MWLKYQSHLSSQVAGPFTVPVSGEFMKISWNMTKILKCVSCSYLIQTLHNFLSHRPIKLPA